MNALYPSLVRCDGFLVIGDGFLVIGARFLSFYSQVKDWHEPALECVCNAGLNTLTLRPLAVRLLNACCADGRSV